MANINEFTITGNTKVLCLFGSPVAHSISPMMHNEAFKLLNIDYRYFCFDVNEDNLEQAFATMRLFDFRGCNCTMPDKNRAYDSEIVDLQKLADDYAKAEETKNVEATDKINKEIADSSKK